jgi:hypothetical protein
MPAPTVKKLARNVTTPVLVFAASSTASPKNVSIRSEGKGERESRGAHTRSAMGRVSDEHPQFFTDAETDFIRP